MHSIDQLDRSIAIDERRSIESWSSASAGYDRHSSTLDRSGRHDVNCAHDDRPRDGDDDDDGPGATLRRGQRATRDDDEDGA